MGPLLTLMLASLVTLGLSNVFIERSLERGDELLTVVSVLVSDAAWVTQSVIAFVLLPLGGAPRSGSTPMTGAPPTSNPRSGTCGRPANST